jgi:RNA polymerase sigma-70 factor (ECF subfamily)
MSGARPAVERDRELVDRANRGDRRALEELYELHRDWVTALAFRFLGSRDDALDVLQETFLYFFGKFPGFRLTSSVRGFLYPAVKHKCISTIRRRKKLVDLAAFREGREPGELRWYPSTGSGRQLAGLVDALPDGQREVVRLRFGLDFRLEEIADALEIPLGTVKSRLHNALKSLRAAAEGPASVKSGRSR